MAQLVVHAKVSVTASLVIQARIVPAKRQHALMAQWTAKADVFAILDTLERNVDAKSAPSRALLPEHLAVTATTLVNAKLASMAIFVKRKNVQMHA